MSQSILYPPAVQPGDAVALVSPSGPVAADKIEAAALELEAWGLRPRIFHHAFDRHAFYAGHDEDRAADLNQAFSDPEIRAVICNRGGYGLQRILERLDFTRVRHDPKRLIGFSDVTALHAALYTQAGIASFHGPVANQLDRGGVFTASTRQALMSDQPMQVAARDDQPTYGVRRAGVAEGILLGGNLSLLSTLVGTPWMPDFTDAILLIEDVGEASYRVDRLLTHLRNVGVLQRLAGVAVGQFSEPGAGGSIKPAEVLQERLGDLGIPVLGGLPIGHDALNHAIALGLPATLDANAGVLTVFRGH